jgi:spermidine synthase
MLDSLMALRHPLKSTTRSGSTLRVPMTDTDAAPRPAASHHFYPVLLCCFVGSGAAALVYEIVWFQLLELVIGSSAISLAVLLATFMGGMCLGSIAFARIVSASWHPLRVYAAMELGIGVIAILVLYCLPFASDWYVSVAGYGFTGLFFRALLCIAFLLPPTVLMGATLPCAARWVERTPHGVSWLGILYTANLAGAVFGCLLAGFYLLRLYDMATATFVAAAINALCAALALGLAVVATYRPATQVSSGPVPWSASSVAVYLTIALSGLTALGAQVVWTRLLSLLLGTSVYTFSIILAAFLFGLGIGSSAGSFIARRSDPHAALGWSQALLVLAIGWTGVSIGAWLPFWPINPLLSVDPWITFQVDLVRGLWAVLPGACLWGASFPLALAAAAPRHGDAGRAVGAVYAANTVGAIIGALTFSMILIPRLGTLWSQRVLMAIAAVAAIVMMAASLRSARMAGRGTLLARGCALAAIPVAAVLLGYAVPSVPGELFAYGRKVMAPEYELDMLYVGEGINASIAVSRRREDDVRAFHVTGKTEATSDPVDMRLQRMLGHWAVLLHPKPRSVLIIGFGAGVTAGSFVTYPEIERIVICEIEPLIPQKVGPFFSQENYDVLKDPRVEVVYDDARHFIATSKETFDIITTDPIHPWVKGAATLYTKEFLDLTRRHLKPDGVVTQWVPLYESTPEVVKSEMATFFSVFPEGIAWVNDRDDGGDVVLFGQANPAPIKFADIDRRLNQPGNERAAESMRSVGFESGMDLLESYAGRSADLKDWLKNASINTDRDLRLQYLAGMGVNVNATDEIYNELMSERKFPEGLFVASPETLSMLRDAIEKKGAEPEEAK